MTTWTTEQLERWIDRHVLDKDGHRVGIVADVYVDDATGEPEWLAVMTGLFGSRISFVPLRGAGEHGDKIQVAYEKSLVKDSPNIEADGQLTEEEEERLYRHYGLTYGRTSGPEVVVDSIVELQDEGSQAMNAEISEEQARRRLRKRDEAAVDSIDLTSEDAADLGATDSPESTEVTKR